ncbi:MAG TPA: hypothetical protein VII98_14525 [Solirubrobacteraceae bacterium]
MQRFRAGVLVLVVAFASVIVTGTLAGPTSASSGFRATLSVPGHHPKAGRVWPVTVTATYNGRGVTARVRYVYLYGGQVVSRQSNYRFHGRFTDHAFTWPARAVGYRLTFRAVVSSSRGSRNLDYWVQVRR